MKSTIPEGESGDWRIQKFTVSKEESDVERLRSLFSGSHRYVPEGSYTRLAHKQRGVIMSDTPDEIRDSLHFVRKAQGTVLVNGLGLGCLVEALLEKPEVTEIMVIEKEADVIALVAPYLTDPRLTVVHADAFEWKPPKGKRWNCVWHDIWDEICVDNMKGMSKLHRKYGRRCDYQDSWCRDLLRYLKRRDDAQERSFRM